MTDTTDDVTNDEVGYDLSAWEPPVPPPGLADAVLARMDGTGVGAVAAVEPREPKRWGLAIAGVAAAVFAASLGTYAVIRGSRSAGPSSGGLVAERARSLALGGVAADLDRGAEVRWERRGGVLHVEQRAGAVAWRVDEEQRLVIDAGAPRVTETVGPAQSAGAPVASVEATGANVRVEVQMNTTDARTIGASALTAAVVSLVTVTVYTGHVKVGGQGQPMIVVQPGVTHTIAPPGVPAHEEPPVVGAAIPEIAGEDDPPAPEPPQPAIHKAPQPRPAPRRMTSASGGPALDRAAITSTLVAARPEIRECGELSTASGKVKVKVRVEPKGNVSSAVAEHSHDDKVGACVVKIMRGLQFPATDQGGSFSYPFVFGGSAKSSTTCDASQLKEQGMQRINRGQHAAALESFEASLRCKHDTFVLQLAFMESCASQNSQKAKHYYKQLSPAQQTKFAQICIRNRVAYDGDMTVVDDNVGYLRLRSTPAAKVLIDGKHTGLTTPIAGRGLSLGPGKHKVTLVVGRDRYTYAVVIEAGETTSLTKQLE